MATPKPPSPSRLAERTPLLEWIAAGAGLAATLGVIGFLVWEGMQPGHDAAVVEARAGRVIATPTGYLVEVQVRNAARAAAAAVEVEGVLRPEGREPETAVVTFDYVPGRGERRGTLVFQNDPRRHALTVATKGHIEP